MPIYEYRCTVCGHIEEEWVKSFNSPTSEPCPKCGAEAVRIVSDTSFQLKGGGWYVTDYKKSGAPQSHEPADPPASGSSAESPAESAPKTEPEAKSEPSAATSTPPESKPESKTASATA